MLPLVVVAAVACSSKSSPASPTPNLTAQPTASATATEPIAAAGQEPSLTPTTVPGASTTETPAHTLSNESTPTVEGEETAQPSEDTGQLMYDVFLGNLLDVVQDMKDSGNEAYIPVIIEIMRFRLNPQAIGNLGSTLASLSGQEDALAIEDQIDWFWWVEWLGNHPEIQAPEGYAGWKGQLYSRFHPSLGTFFYDGVKTNIRLEEIAWGGVAKDGIPDLTNSPVISAEEATYLSASDRVFGVSINGEHRAYPLRIMNPDELANDVLGGVPIALVN